MTEVSKKTAELVISPEDTKNEIRTKIWSYLDASGLSFFPSTQRKRISNFKGSDEAGCRLAEMEVFKQAQVIRVDPDRPLQEVRIKTLEAEKTLLLPTPRLLNHVFSKIIPPKDADQKTLRNCVVRQGIRDFSEPIDIDEKMLVHVVVVGCIAVSRSGLRIGKGGGLSDLEYAMMASLDLVHEKVPVITMVHDDQVVDLPEALFQPHDLPVDFIVTPTQVIQCSGGLKKPSGIIWNLINEERLDHIPVLRRIRFRDWKEGKDVKLEGEKEQPEKLLDVVLDEPVEPEKRGQRRVRKTRRNDGVKNAEEGETTGDDEKKESTGRRRNNRNFDRSNKNKKTGDRLGSDGLTDDERNKKEGPNGELREGSRREGRRNSGRRRGRVQDGIEGSVYVGGLPKSLRVSEFKTEVRGRQVNPLRVLWRGQYGFAFLNFKTMEDAEQALTALEGLSMSDQTLRLEMAKSSNERRVKDEPAVSPVVDQGDGDNKVE